MAQHLSSIFAFYVIRAFRSRLHLSARSLKCGFLPRCRRITGETTPTCRASARTL